MLPASASTITYSPHLPPSFQTQVLEPLTQKVHSTMDEMKEKKKKFRNGNPDRTRAVTICIGRFVSSDHPALLLSIIRTSFIPSISNLTP